MKNKKAMLVAICAAVVLTVSAAGTIAYLTDTTAPVKNTFTMGRLLEDPLSFVLKEHEANDLDSDGVYELNLSKEVDKNTYDHVLPGVDLPKDPFAKTTETLKLDAYVFVEVVDGTGTNLHFTVDADKWTELSGKTGPKGGKVYVMKADGGIAKAGAMLDPVPILAKNEAGKEITVDNAEIADATAQFGGSIEFYGYMIQAGGFADYNAAWAGLNTEPSGE